MDAIATYRIAEPRGTVTGRPVAGAPAEWDATGVVAQVEAATADPRASLLARVFAAAATIAPVTHGPELLDRLGQLLPHLPDGGARPGRADLMADGSVAFEAIGPAEAVVFQNATLSELIDVLGEAGREILVRSGSCAVYRTAGGTFVTGDLDRPGGSGLSSPSTGEGLADGRWVIAGRLPAGADRAVESSGVPIAYGNGVWLAVTEVNGLAVRFEDDDGSIVAAEHPADWPREPVPDATEDCPACGARDWQHLLALDGSRGASNGGPAGILVCRVCGYEIGTWTFLEPLATDESAPAPVRRRPRPALGEVAYPVYAVVGEPAKLGGHGGVLGRTDRVTISHPGGSVTSSVDEPHPRELADALAGHLGGQSWPELSRPALSLWLDARDRERGRSLAAAQAGARVILVDGEPATFDTLQHEDVIAAAATVGEVRIVLAGRWPDTAELRRVADPSRPA